MKVRTRDIWPIGAVLCLLTIPVQNYIWGTFRHGHWPYALFFSLALQGFALGVLAAVVRYKSGRSRGRADPASAVGWALVCATIAALLLTLGAVLFQQTFWDSGTIPGGTGLFLVIVLSTYVWLLVNAYAVAIPPIVAGYCSVSPFNAVRRSVKSWMYALDVIVAGLAVTVVRAAAHHLTKIVGIPLQAVLEGLIWTVLVIVVIARIDQAESAGARGKERATNTKNYHISCEELYERYNENGQLDREIAKLEAALSLHADDIGALGSLSYALYLIQRDDEAEPAYRKALALEPGDANLYQGLGYVLLRQERFEEAVVAYREAVRLGASGDETLWHALGIALGHLDRVDEATQAFREALRLKPDFADAHCNFGRLLTDSGKYDLAEAELREAIRLVPDISSYWLGLGNLLSHSKRPDEAAEAWRKTLRLEPDSVAAHHNLGLLYLDDRPEEAEAAFREAVRLDPLDVGARCSLGEALSNLGRN